MAVVQETLKEIGASDKPVILVMNKIDALPDREALSDLMAHFPDAIFVSATRFIGLDTLRQQIVKTLADFWVEAEISLPFDRYDLVSRLKRSADIIQETVEQDGYHYRYRMGSDDHARFLLFAKNAVMTPAVPSQEP